MSEFARQDDARSLRNEQPETAPPTGDRVSDRRSRTGDGRSLAQLSTVAVLAAVLASGGTLVALELASQQDGSVVVSDNRTSDGSSPSASTATPASFSGSEDWAGIAEHTSPSVVSIAASTGQGAGAGSGIVWDSEGHIVTNAHVVAGADEVTVALADGRQYTADVVGADSTTDLAVLALQTDSLPEDLKPISRGEADALAVGAPVMAIGNPLGLSGTVTTGIVSSLDRPVTTQSTDPNPAGGEPVVTNAIQTSAPINPGNSGGALVDADGNLVGVNTAIASLGGGGGAAGSIGIGFAIPIDTVASVADQLITNGTATHALLGVTLDDGQVEREGATVAAATVVDVENGSAAAEAGAQPGDAIVAIDGSRIDGSLALIGHVRALTPGTSVSLDVVRDSETISLDVTLGEQTA